MGFIMMRWDTGWDPYSSPMYFLTAGHCTRADWGIPTGNAWWRGTYAGADVAGSEFQVDPRRSGANCPVGQSPCVDADVLVVQINSNLTVPDSVLYGNVANVSSSGTIISPWFNVQGTISGGLQGQIVTMVGKSSGKKTGKISMICMAQQVAVPGAPTTWVLCQNRANYSSLGGDSGAPIFIPKVVGNSQTPSIVGIHSSSAANGYRWFTPIQQIDLAFGNSYFYW